MTDNEGKIKRIYAVLDSVSPQFEQRIRDIGKIRDVHDKTSSFFALLEDVFEATPFANYEGDAEIGWTPRLGYAHRMFNGKYYELVYEEDVYHQLNKWLIHFGMDSGFLQRNKNLIKEEFFYLFDRRQLQPRLSLMCFQNGVVDFSMSCIVLRPFSAKYDCVKQYHFAYNMEAYKTCDLWKAFLGEPTNYTSNVCGVLPEKYKRRLLQMFLGSIIMDRRKHAFEHFMILQGRGSNGKSVINKVLTDMFGDDEVSELQVSQLSRSGDEKLRAAAALKGKRLMYCPEESSSAMKDMSFLKSISSGENISCRKIGKNIETLRDAPIIMMNANKEWKASDFLRKDRVGDISVLRRVVILPFDKSIPKNKRDTELWSKLRAEHEGIFAWIVKGYLELKRNKFRMPDNMDIFKELTLETAKCPVPVNGCSVDGTLLFYLKMKGVTTVDDMKYRLIISSSSLYNNYKVFCLENSLPPVSIQKFGRDMIAIGFLQKYTAGKNTRSYEIWWKESYTVDTFMSRTPVVTIDNDELFFGEELTDEEFFEEVSQNPDSEFGGEE